MNRVRGREFAGELGASLRLVLGTLVACSFLYPLLVWALASSCAPWRAEGSLLRNRRGVVVGSAIIAQSFTRPGYFWPRPSAVGYNGAGSGGSNVAAASGRLRASAGRAIARLGGSAARPVPADLVAASGSGLDPHISLAAAEYQLPRVARARGVDEAEVRTLVRRFAFRCGGSLEGGRIVNVLLLNLALDARCGPAGAAVGR